MHASSELREWFLEWLDGDCREDHDQVVTKLNELRSCTDELPAAYCQHGMLHLPFGVVKKDLSVATDTFAWHAACILISGATNTVVKVRETSV